jgi:branched-subunit amino acid aminotransferase/4-amino-4-deoxychorismate lyase
MRNFRYLIKHSSTKLSLNTAGKAVKMHQSVPIAYLNARFLPQSEAHLTLHDAGFVWGATVTDLCRTFGHRPFRLPDHLRRFRQSCELAYIPLNLSDDELTAVAERLVAHNAPPGAYAPGSPGGDLAVVFFATPGPVGYYLGEPGGPGDGPSTLGVHTFPLPFARYQRLVRDGAVLVTPSVRHVFGVDPRIKQRSRLAWWIAEQEARRVEPGASALLLDADGFVTETAAANFLVVRGGTVFSPPRAAILNGVSLQVVEELCRDLGVPFEERRLTVEDCRNADEAMLAGTSYCLAGVRRVAGADLSMRGSVRRRLLDEWGRRVGVDIERQILSSR